MATDYDAPRKTEEDTESIQALQERVPDKLSGVVDSEDADNLGSLELAGQDLANVELDVVVLPPQADEFTCVECFLVKHRSQRDHDTKLERCDELLGFARRHQPVRRGIFWVSQFDSHHRVDPGPNDKPRSRIEGHSPLLSCSVTIEK